MELQIFQDYATDPVCAIWHNFEIEGSVKDITKKETKVNSGPHYETRRSIFFRFILSYLFYTLLPSREI